VRKSSVSSVARPQSRIYDDVQELRDVELATLSVGLGGPDGVTAGKVNGRLSAM